MTRIAILTPSLSTADAVSNDVVGMFDILIRNGHDVRIFAETHSLNHHAISEVARLRNFLKSPADVLLYHLSHGWDTGLQLLRDLRCRRVIRYHNVTPAKFFVGFSATDQKLCEQGRRELIEIAAAECDLYLSASAFSMRELIEIGAAASRSFVVPPFHHIDRLATIKADPETLRKHSSDTANILSVGRVVPHKGFHHLIEVFAHYHYEYNKNSRLIIVGKGGEGFNSYSKLLHGAVQKLGLTDNVVFAGGVSDEVLKAYYLVASAFVTLSEHEGFCVPLVEAMSMELPITACASTAIPETVGNAGIVWPERNPMLIAETIDRFVKDNALRKTLGQRGQDRYQSLFSIEKLERTFLQAMSQL